MMRGKDGEKLMGPMFPRLHVNDVEKGGPRAPPRNKMALHEQLSILPQRFHPAFLPVHSNSNSSVPPSSSSQVCGLDGENFFPIHLPLSEPTFLPEKLNGLEPDKSKTSTSFGHFDQENKSANEDDFTVPVLACLQESLEKNKSSEEKGNFTPLNPNATCHHAIMIHTQNSGPDKNVVDPENVDEEESKEVDKCSQDSGNNESLKETEVADASKPRRDCPSGNTERSHDVSEASILDSISATDISHDDVVGIIGQKQFWKAKRAIVNQQRVFAVQVFELHRLIKVQKMIAGSPHLLLEDTSTTTSKPSSKCSPATKLLAEKNEKSVSSAMKHTDMPKKSVHPVECSAALTSKSTPPGPPSACPWYQPQHHPQPQGQQQWLIPVMSPTEGLVYKPYPGPGLSGTGSCGPYVSSTMATANLGNPAYGVPAHQGMGFVPGIPYAGHSYFPTCGIPVVGVGVSGSGSVSIIEQGNRLTESTPAIQTSHIQRREPNHPQLQSPCNSNCVSVPRAAPTVARLQTSEVSDLQGSTGSSPPTDTAEQTPKCSSQNPCPSNEMRGSELSNFSKGARDLRDTWGRDENNELLLFPMAPATAEAERSTQAIRAVPHNATSTSASVARIFRSIQEERKHYDSD